MKYLTLDAGNTSLDLVLWEGKEVLTFKKVSYEELPSLSPFSLPGLGVSVKPSLTSLLREKFPGVRWIKKEEIPVKSFYETPRTLGTDRLLNAYAFVRYYGKDGVVVSAGTALVVDLVLGGAFRGGFITAGVSLKLQALSRRTEGIPPLKVLKEELLLGGSTEECVAGGVLKEALSFVRTLKREWEEAFKAELPVVLCGGEGELLSSLGTYDPLLPHKGLSSLFEEVAHL